MSTVETPAFAAMVQRQIRALGRRVGQEDPVDLQELTKLYAVLDEALRDAVRVQREDTGYSWAQIAAGLGTSRQAAHQRFSTDSGTVGVADALAG